MYVCIDVYVYIYIYIYMYRYWSKYHGMLDKWVCQSKGLYAAGIATYISTFLFIYFMNMYTYIYEYLYMYIYINVCIYVYIRICIYMGSSIRVLDNKAVCQGKRLYPAGIPASACL